MTYFKAHSILMMTSKLLFAIRKSSSTLSEHQSTDNVALLDCKTTTHFMDFVAEVRHRPFGKFCFTMTSSSCRVCVCYTRPSGGGDIMLRGREAVIGIYMYATLTKWEDQSDVDDVLHLGQR